MALKALDPMSAEDFGIDINCALTFTDFDPTSAVFTLEVEDQPDRVMTWSAEDEVATYRTVIGDLTPGFYRAKVRATMDAYTSVSSETFIIPVTA